MSLSTSDEKIITLLDLTVDRADITAGVYSVLQRLKLYRENQDLMERIDVAEVLRDDLEDLLTTEHQLALERLEDDEQENLLNQMAKLSAEGKDAYWTNNNVDLVSDVETLPWHEDK